MKSFVTLLGILVFFGPGIARADEACTSLYNDFQQFQKDLVAAQTATQASLDWFVSAMSGYSDQISRSCRMGNDINACGSVQAVYSTAQGAAQNAASAKMDSFKINTQLSYLMKSLKTCLNAQ